MPSILPGYNYDIFISYRQKDNKGDRWVSEFISALKTELEATFKEDISIFFDENPHDGLLETHDVGASLKDKLRCLIFIPIISQTYCDSKSFAWQNEFCVFNKSAREDQFGRDIKLASGNVASRILPVKIHNLDPGDKAHLENELGGPLRCIEFIYRSAGVNRPLRANEDHPHDNLNKTYYRDQINKVANAVKEIIHCLTPESKKQTGLVEPGQMGQPDYTDSLDITLAVQLSDEKPAKSPAKLSAFVKRSIISLAATIVLLLVLALWGWLRPQSGGSGTLATYSSIPIESPLMDVWGDKPLFSVSPDGRTIAIGSEKGILLRSLAGFSTKLLAGTERTGLVAFSPDGQSLVFHRAGKIFKIKLDGSPANLVHSKSPGYGLFWGIDGYIYFSPGMGAEGIWRISANGGESEQITSVIDSLGENTHAWPQLLPDSKTLLYTALGPSGGSLDSKIVIQQLKSGERKVLINKAIFGRYLANGNLLFANNEGTVFTVPFDLLTIKLNGDQTAVLSGVNAATWNGAAFISVSENGNLAYLPRCSGTLFVTDVVNRSGKLVDEDTIPFTSLERMGHASTTTSVSPSGNYFACNGISYGSCDIWLLNLKTGNSERISFLDAAEEEPIWSPDGNSIAYTSDLTGNRMQLLIQDLINRGNPRLIRTWQGHMHFTSWSRDGWLAAYDYTPNKGLNCYAVSVTSGDSIPIATSPANEFNGRFSPDGRWLAFQSDESSGRYEIYVVSFPKLESKIQVSVDGGEVPRWDRNGNFIYYLSNGFVVAQPVETGHEFKKDKPVRLFQTNALDFDLSPDGQKFYLVNRNLKRPNPPLNLITNWFEELKTKRK